MNSRRDKVILYMTYDGLTDPLGQSQVLPYVIGLRERGYAFHILSCEKPSRFAAGGGKIRMKLESHGIGWTPLRYTRRPPVLSAMYDIARMWAAARRIATKERITLVHCRSYVPSVAGARLARRLGVPFLFDMRGFWPDEKVEGGAWRLNNPMYEAVHRFFKREEAFFLRADGIVVLTEAAAAQLRQSNAVRSPIAVIPCSVDFDLFRIPTSEQRLQTRQQVGFGDDDFVAVYAGSLGTWYMLDEMLLFFSALRKIHPRARLLVATPDAPGLVTAAAISHGVAPDDIRVTTVDRADMPALLAAGDVGLSFVRATPSKVASSPTKVGEYLATGLPVVVNAGIGDTDAIIRAVGGGFVLESFSVTALQETARLLLEPGADGRQERRRRAHEWFALEHALERYATIYERLLCS